MSVTDMACANSRYESHYKSVKMSTTLFMTTVIQIRCSFIVMDIILQFQFKPSYTVHQNDSA